MIPKDVKIFRVVRCTCRLDGVDEVVCAIQTKTKAKTSNAKTNQSG